MRKPRQYSLKTALTNLESLEFNQNFEITPTDILDVLQALNEEIEELWEVIEIPIIMQVEKKDAT